MAADELKPTQPLRPGTPTDPAPEDRRRQPPRPLSEKPDDDETESKKKRPPPDSLIDEYV